MGSPPPLTTVPRAAPASVPKQERWLSRPSGRRAATHSKPAETRSPRAGLALVTDTANCVLPAAGEGLGLGVPRQELGPAGGYHPPDCQPLASRGSQPQQAPLYGPRGQAHSWRNTRAKLDRTQAYVPPPRLQEGPHSQHPLTSTRLAASPRSRQKKHTLSPVSPPRGRGPRWAHTWTNDL